MQVGKKAMGTGATCNFLLDFTFGKPTRKIANVDHMIGGHCICYNGKAVAKYPNHDITVAITAMATTLRTSYKFSPFSTIVTLNSHLTSGCNPWATCSTC